MDQLKIRKTAVAALVAGAMGATLLPGTASAGGFYMGADAALLSTELDYGFTEEYSTNHLRVKAGYEIADFIAVEGHVYTANDDTDIDFTNTLFSLDTGTIVGIYAKPKTNFGAANVYGLIGLSIWDTTYTQVNGVGAGTRDTESVAMFGFGVGGEFNITKNFHVNVEGMVHIGSADYNSFFVGSDSVDVYSLGLAAGVSYKF
jgi:opacity protein-like surface antigen